MALTKVPPKMAPWLLLIFGVLAFGGLVGLMTDHHIWPFAPTESPPAARARATTPAHD